jgi:formylglycine-generating enzyme required for sulfatase activity
VWVNPVDNAVYLYVPPGEFLMGSAKDDPDAGGDEKPQHTVYLDDYWIMQTEVTSAQYQQCVEAGQCKAPDTGGNCTYATRADHPINCVSWNDALAYCRWVGGRLPTEAEWEKAARGTDGRKYPWGNRNPVGDLLNSCDRNCTYYWKDTSIDDGYAETAPVGTYPKGTSPYGALDMVGNVWEWTSSLYKLYPYRADDGRENLAAAGSRVVRGGSWNLNQREVRAARRSGLSPVTLLASIGFRCALSR